MAEYGEQDNEKHDSVEDVDNWEGSNDAKVTWPFGWKASVITHKSHSILFCYPLKYYFCTQTILSELYFYSTQQTLKKELTSLYLRTTGLPLL